MLFGVKFVYVDGSAGREISEEEGVKRLMPSSVPVSVEVVVGFSLRVVNFPVEQLTTDHNL